VYSYTFAASSSQTVFSWCTVPVRWQGGDPKHARPYLPKDKQFLVTRNVPCLKRAAAMEEYAGKEKWLDGEDEGWVAGPSTHTLFLLALKLCVGSGIEVVSLNEN
jgi:hypothetical protein